jgi:hypothetical protein
VHTEAESGALPKPRLSTAQRVRLGVAAVFVAFAVARVAPDAVRALTPLGIFGYATDLNGVVNEVSNKRVKGSDPVHLGDRVRVDRIKPFDRKPGFVGRFTFTRENFDRQLPIDRNGKKMVLRLKAEAEPLPSRIITVIRILIFVLSAFLGAILYLIKPGVATFAFFIFSIGGDYPTTFTDVLFDQPWRQIPIWIGDTLRGAARVTLLLFACSLIAEYPRIRTRLAIAIGAAALVIGSIHAYTTRLAVFVGHPATTADAIYGAASSVVTGLTIAVFTLAFLRAHGIQRQRTGWIVAAFFFAGATRLASDQLFPQYIPLWLNGLLLTGTIVPIIAVWISVIRHRFFEVDFVVSRAMVFAAVALAIGGIIFAAEEGGGFLFYNNTDLAYGFTMAFSLLLASFSGKITTFLHTGVDRYVFPDRRAQRKALEFIAGYILDAETIEDVHRALLQDAAHALKLTFSGIMTKRADGSFELTDSFEWPDDMTRRLPANDDLTSAITRTRSVLTFHGGHTNAVRQAFANERLTFAAPIFSDRIVSQIAVYGNNVMGLDLDPDEAQLLNRVVAHASIALTMIELARYRAAAEANTIIAPASTPSPAFGA